MLFGRVDRVATLLSRDAERIKELRILRLRTSLLRLCILCLALSGPPLWGGEVPGVTLVFHVKWGAGDQTGLAFANPTDRVTNLELFLFNNDGSLADPLPREVVIQPNEQRAVVLTDVFPNVVQVRGFVIGFSDNMGVVGFFLTFAPDVSQIDGAEASLFDILPRSLLFPELLSGNGESTELNVIIGADSAVPPPNFTLDFDLCGADGTCITETREIPSGPFGLARFSGTVASLFQGKAPAGESLFDQSYVTVNVPNGLVSGYQEFRSEDFRGGRNALSLREGAERPFSIFGAQVADTNTITSDITLINPTTDLPATLNLSVFSTGAGDGTPLTTASIVLPPGGVVKRNIRELVDLPDGDYVGWIRVDSDVSNIVGNVTFGDEARTFLSSVQMEGSPQSQLLYSHLADGLGFFTGLTFLNITPDLIDVGVEVFDPAGKMTGSGDLQLAGFEHGARLLGEIIPGFVPQVGGFIRLSASQGIFSFVKDGILMSLSAVPPQRGSGTVSGVVVPAVGQALEAVRVGGTRAGLGGGRFPASAKKGVILDPEASFQPGEMIVRFQPSLSPAGVESMADSLFLEIDTRAPDQICVLRLPSGVATLQRGVIDQSIRDRTLEVIEELNSRSEVIYAQPNHLYQVEGAITPDDPFLSLMWHFSNIFVPEAWEITTGSPDIVVAVIDSGAKFDHPDLGPRLTGGQADFINDPQNSLDGDGRDFDADDPGADPSEQNGVYHGTHVAGTIGAVTNNGLGVAGVNQVSPLRIVRVVGAEGSGTEFDIYQGLLYAVGLPNVLGQQPAGGSDPARVVNMSLGAPGIGPFGLQAVEDALDTGVIIVASAGNLNSSQPHFPSDLPGVIKVGATDLLGNKAPYSNFGGNFIVAPGGNLAADANGDDLADGVISTVWNQVSDTPGYDFYQGTSMATPHVSGVISLMLSADADLSRGQVMTILEETATIPPALAASPAVDLHPFFGVGIINAFQVVASAAGFSQTDPRLGISPKNLDFIVIHDELKSRVFNLGGGTLEVQTPTVVTESGGNWLAAELSGEDLTVSVNRSGLADGRYAGRVELASNGGDGTVEVQMQVGVDESSDIGDIVVLALDSRTLNSVSQSDDATFIGGYQYQIFPFPSGSYLILAGTDNDRDGFICDAGEFCGIFPVSSQPLPVTVETGLDTSGIDFTVAVEEEEFATLSTRRRSRGTRIASRPALGRLLEVLKNARPAGKANEKKR